MEQKNKNYQEIPSWYYKVCPTHGKTPHLSMFGGVCEECIKEQGADILRGDKSLRKVTNIILKRKKN